MTFITEEQKERLNFISYDLTSLLADIERNEKRFRSASDSDDKVIDFCKLVGKVADVPPPKRSEEDLQLNTEDTAKKRLIFTKKEIKNMPKNYANVFACKDNLIFYREKPNGVKEIRYNRKGVKVDVSSKDILILKQKFVEKFIYESERLRQENNKPILLNSYIEAWLELKRRTIKPSTMKGYLQTYNTYIKDKFAGFEVKDVDRWTIQNYLFEFVDKNKHRTAEKIRLLLKCVFDMAADDFGILSPMRKIVLPFRETKSGSALTKDEELKLISYCDEKKDLKCSSAFLVLLFFGLRKSELKTIKVDGESLICTTSKTLLGRNEVERRIPFTPVFKKFRHLIDFERAKSANMNSLQSSFKKIFPNHHLHELRYTFITRCKESGVNPEIVMLWDGHEEDKDVKSSKVDRGYTDFSWEFQLKEAQKVDYLGV